MSSSIVDTSGPFHDSFLTKQI